ncbi:hypothetical protein AcW1_009102 [Taiwanofungus camphoratus]|nr:hypothetical protein AcW1_009102 [Antrodia cinnamomea]
MSRATFQTSAMSDKMIPLLQGAEPVPVRTRRPIQSPRVIVFASLVFWVLVLESIVVYWSISARRTVHIPLNAAQILGKCNALTAKPGPPADFAARTRSDRFQQGTKPVLIRNATLWTGRVQGLEVVRGDLFLDQGLIKAVGHVGPEVLNTYRDVVTVDAHGWWVTPGIIDVHSHLGVEPSPELQGASDGNSFKGLILPWLRSLDGLNTHDEGYALVAAGGVTTALILPGSANAIGGQAFVIKLRPTEERSPSSMLLEPPFGYNGSEIDPSLPPRWRHMKHACGENPARVYSGSRMDTTWAYRQAYNKAREIKTAQDEYCSKALAGDWNVLEAQQFPDDLQWEALVDILRGRVKVQTHCYEAVDFDDFVRLSNEFKFPIAAFHHAHEAYLVPDVLKHTYGEHPPAIAMFSTFAKYKREAHRGSEFAPRILADNDIDVIMKSDHPAIVSRYLMNEAAQAHYYGLSDNIALASVISTPATVLGLDHRIGFLKEGKPFTSLFSQCIGALSYPNLKMPGYDADVVIWDSHPLSLGATPTQVIIDGIPQLTSPYTVEKPSSYQDVPRTPDFDREAADAVKFEGLPPLAPAESTANLVVFTNVSNVWVKDNDSEGVIDLYDFFDSRDFVDGESVVVVEQGRVICSGPSSTCSSYMLRSDIPMIDLEGGALQPGLVSHGSALGLQEIAMESSTTDGEIYDPLLSDVPSVAGGARYLPRAVDGLQYGTRDALIAYRHGVTMGITAPLHSFFGGLSVAFSLGAAHKLEQGAVVQDVTALHVSINRGNNGPSVSTKVATLRKLLLGPHAAEELWLEEIFHGIIPLVVDVDSSDIIATLIRLKEEVETKTGHALKLTIVGGTEAHLLAKELGEANVGVILKPSRPYPYTWDHRRILPGLPFTPETAIGQLIQHNVTVGLGPQGIGATPEMATWAVRNLRFDAAWALLESPQALTKSSAFALASRNVEKLLGVRIAPGEEDLVATSRGDLLSFEGKVVAVISPRRGTVDLF